MLNLTNFGVVLVFLLSALNVQAHNAVSSSKNRMVTLKLTDFKKQILELRENGVEILGINIEQSTVDIVEEEGGFVGANLKNAKVLRSGEIKHEFAPDARYTTYDKLSTFLRQLTDAHQDISRLVSLGKTLEGRDILAVKISTNPDEVDSTKPNVVFNAMHHAREVMTAEVGMDIAEYLLKQHSSNEKVRSWIDQVVIWVIPMVNPDGNNKVWTYDTMWRKNARPPSGVDINRNYPFKWKACNGASDSPSAQDYRGPSANSEPETQVMVNFIKKVRPVMSISFHSYSELVLYPLSCQGEHAPNHDLIAKIGKEIASKLPSDSGNGFYKPGTPWEVLYGVDGGDIDYYYNEAQTLPYVIEMNQSGGIFKPFEPDYAKFRQKTVEKMRAAWGLVMNRVTGSGISGIVQATSIVDGASVTVEGKSANGLKAFRKKITKNGAFHFVLDPGMYSVTVHNGTKTETRSVTVGADRQQLSIEI